MFTKVDEHKNKDYPKRNGEEREEERTGTEEEDQGLTGLV